MPKKIDVHVLEDGITSNEIPLLQEWGEYLAKKNAGRIEMSTSQIRKFFGEIKRIQADFENCKGDVVLLDPKIAYAVGRAKQLRSKKPPIPPVAIEEFYENVKPLIRTIDGDKKKFKHFVQVCEAIVAYHKANGGD